MIRPIGGEVPDFGRPSLNRKITSQGDTRWPSIRRGWSAATLPAGGEVRCPTSGWIQFHGTYAGWSVSDGGAALVLADYGDILPAPAQGVLIFTAGTGTLHLRAYNEEVGGLLAKIVTQNPDSENQSLIIGNAAPKSNDPSAHFFSGSAPALVTGNVQTVFVNRTYLYDGVTPNTHTIYVVPGAGPAVRPSGSAVLPGQSFTFPGGQDFSYIPDGLGTDQMSVEFIQSVLA